MPTSSCDAAGLFRGLRIERLLSRRRLGDRHEGIERRDEIDLLVVHAILVRNGDRDEEDPEDVVALRLDPGPRLVVVDVRGEQRSQRRLVDVLGQLVLQVVP